MFEFFNNLNKINHFINKELGYYELLPGASETYPNPINTKLIKTSGNKKIFTPIIKPNQVKY